MIANSKVLTHFEKTSHSRRRFSAAWLRGLGLKPFKRFLPGPDTVLKPRCE